MSSSTTYKCIKTCDVKKNFYSTYKNSIMHAFIYGREPEKTKKEETLLQNEPSTKSQSEKAKSYVNVCHTTKVAL